MSSSTPPKLTHILCGLVGLQLLVLKVQESLDVILDDQFLATKPRLQDLNDIQLLNTLGCIIT